MGLQTPRGREAQKQPSSLLEPGDAAPAGLQSPAPRPLRRHPHPQPERRPVLLWAAWLGVPDQREVVHSSRTCSHHAGELAARRRARARGAPARAATCSSPDDIWKESANGQSGVYFQSANNDFSRVKRQCLRARSGGF